MPERTDGEDGRVLHPHSVSLETSSRDGTTDPDRIFVRATNREGPPSPVPQRGYEGNLRDGRIEPRLRAAIRHARLHPDHVALEGQAADPGRVLGSPATRIVRPGGSNEERIENGRVTDHGTLDHPNARSRQAPGHLPQRCERFLHEDVEAESGWVAEGGISRAPDDDVASQHASFDGAVDQQVRGETVVGP